MTIEKTDRYVTYANIDCEGNAKRLMVMLRTHIEDPQRTNAFWEKFKGLLDQVGQPAENNGRQIDEIFLIHTYINNLYDIFEEFQDERALALLEKIEEECC